MECLQNGIALLRQNLCLYLVRKRYYYFQITDYQLNNLIFYKFQNIVLYLPPSRQSVMIQRIS